MEFKEYKSILGVHAIAKQTKFVIKSLQKENEVFLHHMEIHLESRTPLK